MSFLKKLKKTLWDSFFGTSASKKKSAASKPRKKAKTKKLHGPKKKAVKSKKPLSKGKGQAVAQKKMQPPAPVSRKSLQVKSKPVKFSAKKVSVKAATPAVKPDPPPGVLIGTVSHFFPQVKVAAIKIEAQNLSVGDEIYLKGVTTNFKTKIASMQINRVPVTQAPKGSEIGILVKKRVREGDQVFKL